MAIFHGTSIPAGTTSYEFENSLRLNSASNAFLNHTAGNFQPTSPHTISCWVKRCKLGANGFIYRHNSADNLYFNTSDQIGLERRPTSFTTTRKFRDVGNWYHIVVKSTSSDVTLYINGVQEQTASGTANPYTAGRFDIGCANGNTQYFDGYIADFHWVHGTALTPDSFGEIGDYGEWKPIEYEGSHGSNGFHLDFNNTTTKHTVTAIGNTQHSTTQKKTGASSIVFDGSGDYLTLPKTDDWQWTGDFTIETWFYLNSLDRGSFFSTSIQDSTHAGIGVMFELADNKLTWQGRTTGTNSQLIQSAVLNTGQWYHAAVVRSGTASGNIKVYLDGVALGTTNTQVGTMAFPASVAKIGLSRDDSATTFDGYMDELRISNVARYTANFTPSTTAFESDNNTQLLIQSDTTNGSTTFTDSSGAVGGLGNDSAGSNHFTLTNITASDQMLDTPTNNFCTWNPLAKGSYVTFSEGNLRTDGNTTDSGNIRSTFHMTTGKWYMEVLCQEVSSSHNYPWIGCIGDEAQIGIPSNGGSGQIGQVTTNSCAYINNGNLYLNGSANSSWGASFTDGDIIGMALDADNGALYFAKNNTWQNSGNPASGASKTGAAFTWTGGSITLAFALSDYDATTISNFGQDGTFAGNTTAGGNADGNGYGNFKYAVPTGFLSLCSDNLDDPAVKPSEHFNTVLYTGSGSSQTITTGLDNDLVWVKNRGRASEHVLVDTVRGDGKVLHPDKSNAEGTPTGAPSLISTGFTVSSNDDWYNRSSDTYVAWNWKAGTSVSGTTTGSGTGKSYTGSVNAAAGFSIISYEGNGTAGHTIPHHLSKAPGLVLIKRRDATSGWPIGSIQSAGSMDFTDFIRLDTTAAISDNATIWNDTAPSSSVFSLGNNIDLNASSGTYIAYCFHSVEGYSKIGSYTGNANVDGTFVYTGFRSRFILTKGTSASGTYWGIIDTERDTYNIARKNLFPNEAEAEGSYERYDILSNGFKHRVSGAHTNGSGTYLFYAIAEQPFKHTNAR